MTAVPPVADTRSFVDDPDPRSHLSGTAHDQAHVTQAGRDVINIHQTIQQPSSPSAPEVRASLASRTDRFTGRQKELEALP